MTPTCSVSGSARPARSPCAADWCLRSTCRPGATSALRDFVGSLVPELPVSLQMDGLCITLAEHWIGAGQGVDNVMGMVVSTGVGGGLILGGRTVRVRPAMPVTSATSRPAVSTTRARAEAAGASRPSHPAPRRSPGPAPRASPVHWRRAGRGPRGRGPVAIAAMLRAGTAIGQAIASATALVDLELVAIGGGFSHSPRTSSTSIRAAIAERTSFGFVDEGAGGAVGPLGRRSAHRSRRARAPRRDGRAALSRVRPGLRPPPRAHRARLRRVAARPG